MATYSSKKYPSGSVTSAQLADGTVVAVDLADGAVTSAKLNSTVDLSGKTVTYRSIVAGDIASGAITTAKITDANITPAKMANSGAELGMRNRIINGGMVIDQRNAGASVSATNGGYTLDRWTAVSYDNTAQTGKFTVQQNAGSVTPPAGFTNYLGITSSATTTVSGNGIYAISQYIEGYNIADLAWGTASAKSVTVSFWVYSSLTGTFGGAINNGAGNYNYPFQFVILSANTWTYCSVVIPAPTSGTWLTTNGSGVVVRFGLGAGVSWSDPVGAWTTNAAYTADSSVSVVGTNGATFYITGVQLEKGTTATSFDYRPYGTELALCQRYYQQACSVVTATGQYLNHLRLPVSMRVGPTVGTITFDTGSGASFGLVVATGGGSTGLSLYQAANHSILGTATSIPLSAEL